MQARMKYLLNGLAGAAASLFLLVQPATAARVDPLPSDELPKIRSQQVFAGPQQVPEKKEKDLPVIREQEEPRSPDRPPPQAAEKPSPLPRPFKGSELKGREIQNTGGEYLGEIKDVIIGRGGEVEFVLVAYGGFLGFGEKIAAVPYAALSESAAQDVFIVGFDREKLRQAPDFKDGRWPELYTEEWRREVRSYYGR
jgi:sporulation protein YlmC with PRC-barrel domain